MGGREQHEPQVAPASEASAPGKRSLIEGGAADVPGVGKQTRVAQLSGGFASLAELEAALGGGEPLDARAVPLAREVGADPSAVRVHRGGEAAQAAARQQARAFTVGNHIVLGADAPAAGTPDGDALMRHELAHTAQQHAASQDAAQRHGPIGAEQPSAEHDADRAAAGAPAAATGLQVQRAPWSLPQQTPENAGALRVDAKVALIRKSLAARELGWARVVVDVFEQTEPAARLRLQRELDMAQLIGAMPDFEATRLGTLGPIADGSQVLNRKRTAYITQVINDFADRAEVFVLFAFRGVYDSDAYEIFAELANRRMLHKLRAMPELMKLTKARGYKLDGFAEPGATAGEAAGGFLGGVGAGLRHAVKDERPGAYQWQKAQLPDEYAGVLSEMEMAEYEGGLTPKNALVGAFDEVTFGVPHGMVDLGRSAVGAAKSATDGEYRAAGEQLTGAAVVLLTHLGVKVWKVLRALPSRPRRPVGGLGDDRGGLKGPEGPGQFVIPSFEGPISAEEARLGAIFELNPEAQAAMGRMLARIGRGGVERLADLVRADNRNALFVAEHGEAGAYALLEANGDVAAAELRLPNRQLAAGPAEIRVAQPGNRPDLLKELKTKEKLNPKHTRNPRFDALSADPDHGGKTNANSLQEAVVGLEAESRGLLRGPIERGPKGIEFYDAEGHPWDVKKPPSPAPGQKRAFDAEAAATSVQKQVRNRFPNQLTGAQEHVRVLMDSSFLTPADHSALWAILHEQLTSEELARIVELNSFP